MKVQDLVEKLLKIDPELDVFVSPLVDVDVMHLGVQDPERPHTVQPIAHPDIKFQALNVSELRSMVRNRSSYVAIGFDPENPHVENTEENSEGESIH